MRHGPHARAGAYVAIALRWLVPLAWAALVTAASPCDAGAVPAAWSNAATVIYHVAADGSYIADETWVARVGDPAVVQHLGQAGLVYDQAIEQVSVTEAYTRKPDGSRVPAASDGTFDTAEPSSHGDMPLFNALHRLTVFFRKLDAGDETVVTYRRTGRAQFPRQFMLDRSFAAADRLDTLRIEVVVPSDMRLATAGAPWAHERSSDPPEGGLAREVWRLDAPAGQFVGSSLLVSTFASYAALGGAWAEASGPPSRSAPRAAALARQLTASMTDPADKARAIQNFVGRQVRYLAVFLGEGGIMPHAPDEVLDNGYGDCKDHTVLMQAMLDAVGIASQPVLIPLSPIYDLPLPPRATVFNHQILYLPQLATYTDPSLRYGRFGVLSVEEYDKPVLLIGADGTGQPARTPPRPPQPASVRATTVAALDAAGHVSGTTTTVAEGAFAIQLSQVAVAVAVGGGRDSARRQLASLGTPGKGEVLVWPLDEQETVHIDGRFALNDAVPLTGDPVPPPAGMPVFVPPGEFLMQPSSGGGCYIGTQIEELRLTLPPDLSISVLPPPATIRGGFARYDARYALDGAMLLITRSFSIDAPAQHCGAAELVRMEPVLAAARADRTTARIAFRKAG